MTDARTTKPTKIEFVQYHQPGLKDGDYTITVRQEVEEKEKIKTDNVFTITKGFTVSGERFDLKPSDIQAVFPPAGSLGEHSNVLPHIVLNRSTLPWERQAVTTNKNIPWLALLLFEEEEKPEPKIITLKELLKELNKNDNDQPNPHSIKLESGQHEDDKVTIIDIKKELLEKIIPTKEDLEYLAHVRQGTDSHGNLVGNELAIIIGNRLPKKGSLSTVHLISVEERYKDSDNSFDFKSAKNDDYIRLVSLKSWSFACVDEKQSFKRLLTHLNRGQYLFSVNNLNLISELNSEKIDNLLPLLTSQKYPLSNPTIQVDEIGILWRVINGNNQQYSIEKIGDRLDIYRRNLSTLRLPKVDNIEAEKYLSMGYVPLPHFLRQGGKTFSWYHSPLIPGNSPTDDITLPVRAADELVRYNPSNGMFDISYAAAWELGRLLALQSKNFSISLYNWKRSHRQSIKCVEKAIDSHLPFHNPLNVELPNEVLSWFENLSLLKGIPFNYLVPDEQMLPIESIRFFCVDSRWIECLLDGAFSIGRVTTSDYEHDCSHEENPAANPHGQVTGFLLRSDVVAGWPSLQVDGYDTIIVIDDDKAVSNNLNHKIIPEKLRQDFKKQGILLSKNAEKISISIIGEDNWQIDDQENTKLYNIHKKDDKVVVYIKLTLLRQDRLSANVLIYLFKGKIKTVDIHQKPETLHFGLDSDDNNTSFYKKLKAENGEQVDIRVDSIPWKNDQTIRTLDIRKLKKAMTEQITFPSFTSAQFALEMIEGVEKVRFTAVSDE
jgi:hypothetical protein